MLDLRVIEEEQLEGTVKGFPPAQSGIRIRDISAQTWNVLRQDVPFPVAVLRELALKKNSQWMRAFTEASGVSICPHGKTTMAPQLFDLQLEDGAWGMTAATVTHMVVYRKFGIRRIILANQLLGEQDLQFVTSELQSDPDFDFYCLIDSLANLQLLIEYLGAHPPSRPLQLLLEIGMKGGRSGIRDAKDAIVLAEAIRASQPLVELRGIEAFEGLVTVTSEEGRNRVAVMLDCLEEVAKQCDSSRLFAPGEIILTAGGSAHFDEVARRLKNLGLTRETRVVLRSGCYLTHDAGLYGTSFDYIKHRSSAIGKIDGGLVPALEVWAQIQSVPEPGLAIATLGKRDISYDIEMPSLSRICRRDSAYTVEGAVHIGKVNAMNDQHAFIALEPGQHLEVGDLLGFGISHPCTTFDKWNLIYLVDEKYTITGAVKTFF